MVADVDDTVGTLGEDIENSGDEGLAEEAHLFNLLHKSPDDRMVKRTPKEETLQAVARSLIFEYGFDLADLDRAFPIRLTTVSQATGKARTRNIKLDIAAFASGARHSQDCVIRAGFIAVAGTKHDDETKGIDALDQIMGALPQCEFGFWTNGTELAFRRKVLEGNEPMYLDIGDMPAAGETLASLANQKGRRRLVAVTPETLAQAFRRCHDYIHGNQGLNKSQAFWEFLRLIFCKMYDEQREALGRERRFWVGLTERFTSEGQLAIKTRLDQLFEEVKGAGSIPSEYAELFRPDERIGLHPPVLAYVAGELARYDMLHSSEDAKGAAYEEIIDRKQKADRGQFFTPRNVIRLMVAMLDPDESDYVVDPACGTGGFLAVTFRHVRDKIEARLRTTWADPTNPTEDEVQTLRRTAREWAAEHIWGFDFDPDLANATRMNLAMNGAGGRIYYLDSLKFPAEGTPDAARLVHETQAAYAMTPGGDLPPIGALGSFTLCLTNPPFGSKIPFNDRHALQNYDLARNDQPAGDFKYEKQGKKAKAAYKASLPPEVLFVERCVQWIRPGGRVGIVLPDGILGNPKDVYIRRWVLKTCDILASVDLPVETFLPQVGVQPSLLFLRKKTDIDLDAEAMAVRADPRAFMAIVERVGKDRRGNVIYKRNADGTDAPPIVQREQHIAYRDGRAVKVEFPVEKPVIDDELPEVLAAWQTFRNGAVL